MAKYQAPRGTRDLLPQDMAAYQYIRKMFEKRVSQVGFQPIDTPIFEEKELFTKSVGQESDIVSKELFEICRVSRASNEKNEPISMVLRPEASAAITRAYIQNGMSSWPQPVKLSFFGPLFRYDRPQAGRLRQFNQADIEIFGDSDPATDALVIWLGWQILNDLKIAQDLVIETNTLGCKKCKPVIKQAIKDYYGRYKNYLCQDCQQRLKQNPLRLLDCSEEKCQQFKQSAPQLPDLVCESDRIHFQQTLEYLDELGVGYELNPYLVRGLDYYTKTTFEMRLKTDTRRQSSLLGGGRYDELVDTLGGIPETPAIGWAMGVERVIETLKTKNWQPAKPALPQIAIIQLGQLAKKKSLSLIAQLVKNGFKITTAPTKNSLKSQLRLSNKQQAKVALIIGQREALDQSVIVRNLEDGSQETVGLGKLDQALKRKLK